MNIECTVTNSTRIYIYLYHISFFLHTISCIIFVVLWKLTTLYILWCLTEKPQIVTVSYGNPVKDWGSHLGYNGYPVTHSTRIFLIFTVINIMYQSFGAHIPHPHVNEVDSQSWRLWLKIQYNYLLRCPLQYWNEKLGPKRKTIGLFQNSKCHFSCVNIKCNINLLNPRQNP